MRKLLWLTVVAACVGFPAIAAAQYTPNQLPNTYGNNKLGTCYNPTANNWINTANTAANIAAFPLSCDSQGNLTSFAPATVVTAAAPGTVRTIVGNISTSNASYANGSASIVGVRGAATIPSGTTASTGYVYGTQGKFILGGVVSGSVWATGLQGQIDISGATLTSASHVTAVWGDAGATGPAVTCAFCDLAVLTNTTATTFNSVIYGYSKSIYFTDLTDNGGGYIIGGSGASSAVTGYLKIKVNGTDAYLRYYAGAS